MTNSESAAQRLEQIVAYLDGEASAEESAEVERLLATDEDFRRELQSVDRSWNALGELPHLTVDDRFARTTMEMVVQTARHDLEAKTEALPVARRRRRLGAATLVAVAGTLGWWLVRAAAPDPNAQLLADLPVIDRIDAYSQLRGVEGVEFLRRLTARGSELAAPLYSSAETSDDPPDAMDERRAWLAALPPERRTVLRGKDNRFRALPPEEQLRFRTLHRSITAADDAAQLDDALHRYQQWLAGLPPEDQFELRSLPLDERVERVCRWVAKQSEEASLQLKEEELKAVADAIRDLIQLPGEGGRPRGLQPGRMLPRRGLSVELVDDDTPNPLLESVLGALPKHVETAFLLLPLDKRLERLRAWGRQVMALRGEVSQEELERFFVEELAVGQREELLLLPTSELEDALQGLYRRSSDSPWARGGARRWRDPQSAGR